MTGKPRTGIFYGWVIVAAASIILALEWGCDEAYAIFLPELCQDLGWSRTMVSGAYTVGYLLATTLGVLSGRLNDRYGPRLMLMFSVVAASLGFALMSIIRAPWQLYIFYGVIANIGMGFAWVPAVSTTSRWFTKKRGMALGVTEAGAGVVILLMMPLTQFLIIKFGWRISYLILAGLIFVIGLPLSRLMRLDPSEKGLYPDGVKGITENEQNTNPKSDTVDFTLKQATKTRQFWLLFFIYVFSALPFGIWVHLKAYMVDFGIAEMTAATVIGINSGTHAAGAIVISKLSDRIGRKVPLFISFLLIAVAMLWLVKARQPWEFYLFSIISGFSFGGFVLFPAIIADHFGMKCHGSIFGMLEIGDGIGGAFAPLLAGYIFDTTGSYEPAIIMGAIALFVAMGLSLLIKAPQKAN